ncbi:MAG TPA: (2Fe-2S)-binding protein, partial [bacterium]|nr:(2Fe-2S)-binding protein [bacterium]
QSLRVEPRWTLAEVLRDHLHLTGTKTGCERGACGACTVWMNDKTINACLTLAVDAIGSEITTIEGLSDGMSLHPLQQAFIEHDALQCGFCTPGMVMSCAALLRDNKNPSIEDVKDAVSGNLCRCGTYNHVFEAVQSAAKNMK